MTWVKLDDRTAQHPKLLAAGPEAFALWIASLCYANSHHTDGLIPRKSLAALYPGHFSTRKLNKLAGVLVEVSLWIPTELGWFLHDYLDYQSQATREKVKETREKNRRNQAKSRASKGVSVGLSPGDTSTTATPGHFAPTRPVPSRPKTHTEKACANEPRKPRLMGPSSMLGIPHPNEPGRHMSSGEYVIECFRAVGRSAGKNIVRSSLSFKDHSELERIERMVLETITELNAIDPQREFARLVNGVMNRYRHLHTEDPEGLPWKAAYIATRWPELSEGFEVAA